jgi:hypothetical protein
MPGLSGRAGRTMLIVLAAALIVGAILHIVTLVLHDHGHLSAALPSMGTGRVLCLYLILSGSSLLK